MGGRRIGFINMKGSKEKENPSDIQCDYCKRWFSNRGITAHELHCEKQLEVIDKRMEEKDDGNDNSSDSDNSGGVNDSDGGINTGGDNSGSDEDIEVCIECGNRGDGHNPLIYITDSGLKQWMRNNDIWVENKTAFFNNDYLCMGCKTFFSDDE